MVEREEGQHGSFGSCGSCSSPLFVIAIVIITLSLLDYDAPNSLCRGAGQGTSSGTNTPIGQDSLCSPAETWGRQTARQELQLQWLVLRSLAGRQAGFAECDFEGEGLHLPPSCDGTGAAGAAETTGDVMASW